MLSSPFDFFGALKPVIESAASFLAEHGTVTGGIAVAAVTVAGVKVFTSSAAATGGAANVAASSSKESADSMKTDENAGEKEAGKENAGNGPEKRNEDEKRKEEEKRKEDELRRSQEMLDELFDLFGEDREQSEKKECEEKEKEELGEKRRDLEQLKEQYKELTQEIAALLEKGMTPEQTAKALISRTAEQIPEMEFRPLIEAMTFFLQKQENCGKNTGVIGVDPQFEQRAALSALKRGDQEAALDYLERQAAEAMNKASSSLRNDVCCPAMEQAAALYRAVGVLTRPSDPERSFEALKKSKELDPENTTTQALVARAYYESGKEEKAENVFENIAGSNDGKDYAAGYASQMSREIKTKRVMQQAARIREEYENRLADAEGRQKTDTLSLQKQKHAEVMRANNRFIADELTDRDNENVRM